MDAGYWCGLAMLHINFCQSRLFEHLTQEQKNNFCQIQTLLSVFCLWMFLFSTCCYFAPPNAMAEQILEGRIEHSPSLPPVDKQWKTGAKFDAGKLPVAGSESIIWWRVPSWLAGTWHNVGKVKRLSFKDLQNPESNQGFDSVEINYPDSEVIGYQTDRLGFAWTCVPAPYVGRSEQGDKVNVSIIHSAVPVELSDTQVVIKFLATTLTVGKGKGRILAVTQRESLQTYKQIETGKILVQASMQYYDENGTPRYESKVLSNSKLQEAYKETPYLPYPGNMPTLIDLRKSFDKFLRSRNLESLIPDRIPLQPVHGYKIIVL